MADPLPPQDPFEMFRRLWGPLGVPLPGMAMPTFDPQEVEKRIADLRSVEAWLNMNLNMIKLDRKSTRLNSSHQIISYAVFCLKKKKQNNAIRIIRKSQSKHRLQTCHAH